MVLASVAVPLPLSMNVTPLGRVPLSLSVGVGTPVAVTVNVPAMPVVNVVAGGAGDRRRLVDRQREALCGVGESRRWRR